jgi:hypothetical protein
MQRMLYFQVFIADWLQKSPLYARMTLMETIEYLANLSKGKGAKLWV